MARAPSFLAGLVTGGLVLGVVSHERRILSRLDLTPDADTDDGLVFPMERSRDIRTSDGGRIHVEECGAGPPVVMVHGHGSSLAIFAPLATRLAARGRRVVAIDHRGFGRSSAVPTRFGFDGLVDDLVAALEALDLRDAVVVGHSMGGAVALGLAVHHADVVAARVAAIVQVNGTSRGPPDRPIWRAKATVLDWSVTERVGRHPRHGLALTMGNFGHDARRSHVVGVRAVGFASPASRRRGLTRRLLGVDLSGRLAEVAVPVLVLAGEHDRVIAASETALIAESIGDARLVVLPGAGHVLPVERADAVADEIVRFAEEVDQASASTSSVG